MIAQVKKEYEDKHDCKKVPREGCKVVTMQKPRKSCKIIPKTKCTNIPGKECKT
jgi:hypothetical protein